MPQTIPLSVPEVERMRQLLYKVKIMGETLTGSGVEELRQLISRDEPEEAKNSDIAGLISVGMFLFSIYISILKVESNTLGGISVAKTA